MTVPSAGEGISMAALSVSTSSRGCSSETLSPGVTKTSITCPDSIPSPSSGSLNSINSRSPSRNHGIRLVPLDSKFAYSGGDGFLVHPSLFVELGESRKRYMAVINFKEIAKRFAGVASSESVGPKRNKGLRETV